MKIKNRELSISSDNLYINTCPIGCQSSLIESKFIVESVPLLKCTKCHQLIKQCSKDEYSSILAGFNTSHGTCPIGKALVRSSHRFSKRLKIIEKLYGLLPSRIRLLDVGCSSGSFISFAKSKGYIVTGVEPAHKAAETAIQRGLDVKVGYLEDLNMRSDYFDVITLFEVIEHLKDPVSLLKECNRILKKEALLMIGTGNTASWTVNFTKSNWDYFLNRGHISFFNPLSMYKLAQRTGYTVIKFQTRRVDIYHKDGAPLRNKISTILAELLTPAVKVLNKGHDALFLLKKN